MGDIESEVLSSPSALADGADDWSGEDLPFDIQFAADERLAGEMNENEGFASAATLTT